jgi:hypothetical protein
VPVVPPVVVVVVLDELVEPLFAGAPPVVAGWLMVVLVLRVVELHGCHMKRATSAATMTIATIANVATELPDPSLTTIGRSAIEMFSFKRVTCNTSFPSAVRTKPARQGVASLL